MSSKIIHLKKDCISCGACAVINPDNWEMDEEGLSQLKGSTLKGDRWELDIEEDAVLINKEAQDCCPVDIIHVVDREN